MDKKIIYITIAIVLLIAGTVSALSFYAGKNINTKLIDQLVQQKEKEITDKYEEQVGTLQGNIDSLNTQLIQSDQRIASLTTKLKILEGQKANVQIPKTNQETVDRFTGLGFPPIK